MLYHPGEMKPEQPGINGIRFAKRSSYLYYTATVLKLFMRVRVDPETLAPLGVPEYVGGGKMMDDFCLDEERGVAYVTTHRENTLDRMPLTPHAPAEVVSVAGSLSIPSWLVLRAAPGAASPGSKERLPSSRPMAVQPHRRLTVF